jgi:hypothetical protein
MTPPQRTWLWLGLAIFLASRLYILVEYQPAASDVILYVEYALKGVDFGQVAYRDFRIEYPPAAWWLISIPRHMAFDTYEDPKEGVAVYHSYVRWFHGELCILDGIALIGFLATVRQRHPDWLGAACFAYAASTALLWHLLYERLDMGLLACFMVWAACWTAACRAPTPSRATLWSAAAYACIGLGIAYKVIPVIALPFMAWSDLMRRPPARELIWPWTAGLAALLIPFAVHFATAGPGVFGFVGYHKDRGLEVCSLYASLMMLGKFNGTPLTTYFANQSWNLRSPGSIMPSLAGVSLLIFLGGAGLWALLDGVRFSRQRAYRWSLFALTMSVILSKVLSPQYFIWAFPLAILLALEVGSSRQIIIALMLCPLLAALTTWLFPYNFYSGPTGPFQQPINPWGLVPDLHWPAVSILLARNLLYLVLIVGLGGLMLAGDRRETRAS